jgi:rSAM/selenodomain-associated transferase 2
MTLIPQQTSNISIIIPTLNEAEQVGNWRQLRELMENHICEIIVVDGGSSDETVSLARSLGFRTEICPAGRGRQLNHGARVASGAILLFLHADTQLPANFDRLIRQCLNQPSTLAGAFSLSIEGATLFLRFICLCANLRSRLFQLPYGDQGIFISRDNFLRSGGFPETPIMEDFIYIRKARRTGRIRTLPQHVTTSARRWQRLGIIRTTLINQLVILGYYAGIPLRKLALLYRR